MLLSHKYLFYMQTLGIIQLQPGPFRLFYFQAMLWPV